MSFSTLGVVEIGLSSSAILLLCILPSRESRVCHRAKGAAKRVRGMDWDSIMVAEGRQRLLVLIYIFPLPQFSAAECKRTTLSNFMGGGPRTLMTLDFPLQYHPQRVALRRWAQRDRDPRWGRAAAEGKNTVTLIHDSGRSKAPYHFRQRFRCRGRRKRLQELPFLASPAPKGSFWM